MNASISLQKPRERTLAAFLLALCIAAAIFIPFLIIDKGYFIFYGDFNVQQIPFYQMAHDAVRSGDIFWSWTTDLGTNFVGSYSFYLLGSPFFLITLLFPSAVVPFLMAPLLVLKFALSSLAAYLFLRRFLRPDYALLGGLLYAFSGFSIYNIFFNHFHESIIYFPLMLLAMELYMSEGRKGFFALTVFLSALCNYYFFIGQAIFLIIYWVVRAMSGGWQHVGRRFFGLLFEAIVGTAAAAVLLLPSYLSVIQNPRTDNIIAGWDLLIYTKPQRLLDIIHSFFFPQDIPARAAFFPGSDNKWSSMSAWVPVFGCTGVIAYLQSRKHRDWIRRLIIVLLFFAMIPGLNAMFQLFNSMYYARWYYMLVLVFALATMRTIQDDDEILVNWRRAFGWTAGISAAFALVVALAPVSWKPDEKTGRIVFGLYNKDYPEFFWIAISITAVSLVLAALLVSLRRRERKLFIRWSVGITVSVILIFGWYSIGAGKLQGRFSSDYIIDRAINGAEKIKLPESDFTRVDFNNDLDNIGMFWKMPTIQAFHSIVPGSIMELYPSVGVDRGVGSRPENSHYALRGLLSVGWLFDYANDDEMQSKSESSYFVQKDTDGESSLQMPGWSYFDKQNGFLIYKNDEYIPPGFTYDSFVTRTKYESLDKGSREMCLLKSIVLEDADAEKYEKYLDNYEEAGYFSSLYDEQDYFDACAARRETTATLFKRDNRGFSAVISMPKENLVFFSVPYEQGWSAKVDGKPADIVRVNVGFMAVLCPAGEDVSIRFDYMTPGLVTGGMVSLSAIALFAVYFLAALLIDRRRAASKKGNVNIPPKLPGENTSDAEDGFDLYKYYTDNDESRPQEFNSKIDRPGE